MMSNTVSKDIDYPERPRISLSNSKDIDYPERPRISLPKKVTISFAADPKNQQTLIYKIDTGAETFYVQTDKKLPESALKELAKLASDATLPEASINNHLKKQNINGQVIDQTNDIKNLQYIMPKIFQVNQQIDPQNRNPEIAAGSPQLKMG